MAYHLREKTIEGIPCDPWKKKLAIPYQALKKCLSLLYSYLKIVLSLDATFYLSNKAQCFTVFSNFKI